MGRLWSLIAFVVAATVWWGCQSETEPSADAGAPCPVSDAVGTAEGDVVLDVEVTRCDGSTTTVHELVCGHQLTLIDIGVAAFQTCVDATDAYATDPAYDALQARGLQIVQIFVGDEDLDTPTTLFCANYSEAHAIDFEFAIDQLRNTSLITETFPFNYVVDDTGIIVHRWSEDIPDDKLGILDALLSE